MNIREFNELSPEEQAEIRGKARAFTFFAAIAMMLLGFSAAYESVVILTREKAMLVDRFGTDAERVFNSSLLTLPLGGFEMFCAWAAMRLRYVGWRFGFFATVVLLLNSIVSSIVFNGTPITFSTILTAVLSSLIFILLYKGKDAFSSSDAS
ncbi:MAG: hypothetical protein HY22_13855 [[Candidatus Thermochlorobacteriaceae] bacterium GBChlB]|nr:MAG: hypothetical protein HY22_13855 [[Candidatus Thermochlorobacteriaceae] bacterium GBChlB]